MSILSLHAVCQLLTASINFRLGPLPRLALDYRQRHAARLHTAIPSPCGMDPPPAGAERAGGLAGWLDSRGVGASECLASSVDILDNLSFPTSRAGQSSHPPTDIIATGAGEGNSTAGRTHTHMLEGDVERAEGEDIPWQINGCTCVT